MLTVKSISADAAYGKIVLGFVKGPGGGRHHEKPQQ